MFEPTQQEPPSIGLTPLIDVVFILLIFVVLAANFDRIRGLKVDLPQASNTQKPEKKTVVVSISAKGEYMVQDQKVQVDNLGKVLRKMRKKHEILILRADAKSDLKHTVKVLDIAKNIGFSGVSIAAKGLASGL